MTTSETVFTNAEVVTPDDVMAGTVLVKDGLVADVASGHSRIASAINLEGDYLVPGLVEIHTDNLEHNVMPRPAVLWPVAESIIAHDAQMAVSGVTTVFDALTVGGTQRNEFRSQLLRKAVAFITEAIAQDRMRAEHYLHLRCEISAADMMELLEPVAGNARVRLVSIMDHTPGQRQWIDVEKYRYRNKTRLGLSDAEADSLVRRKFEEQVRYAESNRKAVLEMLRHRPLPLATHDDTTEADVDDAVRMGATISEFPTTGVAATAARAKGLSIVMGAPNIVLGGSHSGNVSAAHLASKRELDILSSDYVPASLVQACWILHRDLSIPLHTTIGMVTRNPARSVGLTDRGSIAVGQRADLIRIQVTADGLPVVRAAWRAGQRIAQARAGIMRYAIYYVPPREEPLADFGAAILGYDVETGRERERLVLPGIPESRLVGMTRRVARYGFHATLKAPFRLAAGRSRIDVLKLAADTADRCRPVEVSGLELAMFGNFVALRPQQACPELDAVAATFVRDLDPLRVVEARDETKWPLGKLSPQEGELLEAWGYPYVLDQYRFHMTLTDALNSDEAVEIIDALKPAATSITGIPLTIDAVTVMEEIHPTASFRAIARFHLRGLRPTC